MLHLRFTTEIIHWRGPAPFYFAPVPADESRQIAQLARQVSYGWGVIPVEATIGGITFHTSLFPRDGAYLLPLRNAVRKQLPLQDDVLLTVEMTIGKQAPERRRPLLPRPARPIARSSFSG